MELLEQLPLDLPLVTTQVPLIAIAVVTLPAALPVATIAEVHLAPEVATLPAAPPAAITVAVLQALEADTRRVPLPVAATIVQALEATTLQAVLLAVAIHLDLPVAAIAAEVPQEEAVTAALHTALAVPPTAVLHIVVVPPIAAVDTDNKPVINNIV